MASQSNAIDDGSSLGKIELRPSDLPSMRLIGKGQCGIVYETIWNGKRYARKDFVDVPTEIFREEAAALLGLKRHKNIVNTYGLAVDNRSCSLVLEYTDDDLLSTLQKRKELKCREADRAAGKLPEGSSVIQSNLHKFIEERRARSENSDTCLPPFKLREALHVMLEIATGMAHLHDEHIAHGDLKPRNVLVTYSNEGGKSVKVADFGLVQTKSQSMLFASRQARKLDMARWKSPEYLEVLFRNKLNINPSESDEDEDMACPSNDYNLLCGADVYSFAVTSFQILTGDVPYPNLNWKHLVDEILQGRRPQLPPAFQKLNLLCDLLESCWSPITARRLTFSAICIHLKNQIQFLKEESFVLHAPKHGEPSDPGSLQEYDDSSIAEPLEKPKHGEPSDPGSLQVDDASSVAERLAKPDPCNEMLTLTPSGNSSEDDVSREVVSHLVEHDPIMTSSSEGGRNPDSTSWISECTKEWDTEKGYESKIEVLREIDNILWMDGLASTPENRCKEALKLWRKKDKLFTSRIDRKQKQSADFWNQVYQLIGFYSIFQVVLLTAVAQSNLLHCNNTWTATLLSILSSIATFIGVYSKLKSIADLEKTIASEKWTLRVLVNWQLELKRSGPSFRFSNEPYRRRSRKRSPWVYILILLSLFLVSAVFLASFRQILCNPGHSLVPGTP